ncbi:MAG: hypothetical protein JXK16_03415 [Thiotrichales bacterium]|nr:hypothetical protein [Thiotrichales bacterium]
MPLKRKILYIPGFDPRSASFYKKTVFQAFPEIKQGVALNTKNGFVSESENLVVDYEVLSWHQEVKAYWAGGLQGNVNNVFSIFKEFVFRGAWGRMRKLSKRDSIQKYFSVYFFSIWIALNVFASTYFINDLITEQAWLFFAIATSILVVVNVLLYRLFDKIHMFWISRIIHFFSIYSHQQVPLVMQKEAEFKVRLLALLDAQEAGEFDEVVLVAHSVGTVLCMNMLADLMDDPRTKNLKVVTLGHCVTAVSVIKSSGWFNEKLKRFKNRQFEWIDVTAGKDAVNFYKISPGYHADIKPDLTLSANFHEVFEAEFYKKLKWDFYRIHFLYLEKPHAADASQFNYQKLLFDAGLFKRLSVKKNVV